MQATSCEITYELKNKLSIYISAIAVALCVVFYVAFQSYLGPETLMQFRRLIVLGWAFVVADTTVWLLRFLAHRTRFYLRLAIESVALAAAIRLAGPTAYPLLVLYALPIVLDAATGETAYQNVYAVCSMILLGLAILARDAWRPTADLFWGLTLYAFVMALALPLGYYYSRAERDLRRRLTEMVEDLRRLQTDQETQLKKLAETHMLLEERYAETYALYLIKQEISAELDVDKILPKVADIVQGLLGGRSCSIILAESGGSSLRQAAVSGSNHGPLPLSSPGNLLARAWQANAPFSHKDLADDEWAFWRARGANGLLISPISTKTERVGLILVEYDYLPRSLEDHQDLLGLVAGQLSLALENAYLYRKLQRMATHDALTGLANRHYFQERLTAELETARRERPLSAIIIDIDRFKTVNDEYGHEAGDEVLRMVAGLLMAEMGPEVTVARYGGEEFVVLLPGVGLDEAVRIAEGLRKKVKEHPCRWDGKEIALTISLGVASYPHHAKDRRTLLRLADRGLYLAKEERDRVAVAGE